MCEKNITNRRTPLRNSNSANKPFRSPLTTVVTPNNNGSPHNPVWQSPMLKTTTPKRSLSQFRHPIKKRRIDNAPSDDSLDKDSKEDVARTDFLALKRRIRTKRLELENLKTKSNYMKKHRIEDLLAQIEKWRAACKEALYQFHKDIGEKSSEHLSMRQVLAMLSIPADTVKFTSEECDLT